MKSGADCGEIAAFVEEMSRRRKLALTYFHPRLHAPAAAQLRRERNVVWDRRLGVYLFPDRATLDRCRAACEALDARAAADERARLEAAGYDVPVYRRPLDRRSDVFSAGIILWELLSGKRLYRPRGDVPLLEQARRRRADARRGPRPGACSCWRLRSSDR